MALCASYSLERMFRAMSSCLYVWAFFLLRRTSRKPTEINEPLRMQLEIHPSYPRKLENTGNYATALGCFYLNSNIWITKHLRNIAHHWGPHGIIVTDQSALKHWADRSQRLTRSDVNYFLYYTAQLKRPLTHRRTTPDVNLRVLANMT